ncbi:MAG TPA: DUF1697 domain-containing protein [Acidimicrobiia bacterium]|jgi:uncharacterized protein (DUF1697 family)|nr:DUF1697 domain-containing protein [Acidimicrobiia bacterium]
MCVALMRGIGPGNPNMKNENYRRVAEGLGLQNVSTFISTGNVIFDTQSADIPAMERAFEEAWVSELGFTSTTIIRTLDDLEALVEADPFQGRVHGPSTYLLVTFARRDLDVGFDVPHQLFDGGGQLVAATARELFTVTDTTSERAPNVMGWLEREFGKEITSRTWLSVTRILNKMR